MLDNEPLKKSEFDSYRHYAECKFNDIESRFDKIDRTLNYHEKLFKDIFEILKQHSVSLLNIENTINIYSDMYKINREQLDSLDIRVTALENT